MATVCLDPGGDATGDVNYLSNANVGGAGNTAVVASQTVTRLWHKYAYLCSKALGSSYFQPRTTANLGSAGRMNLDIYVTDYPSALNTMMVLLNATPAPVYEWKMDTNGTIQLWQGSSANQIGVTSPVLTKNVWHRITLAWNVTSTTVNNVSFWLDGVLVTNVVNTTLSNTGMITLQFGNISGNAQQMYVSDLYVDTSSAMTDPGDIWVTAKRPFANGSLNQWALTGSSSYGSGHAVGVNDRPLSVSNHLTVTPTTVQTEEFTIEGKSTGDVDMTNGTIIDYLGWMYAKVASTSNTPVMKLILNNVGTTETLTTSDAMYAVMAGSTSYPAGNTDIGMSAQYTTTGHLVTLEECGVIFAFLPAPIGKDITPLNNNLGAMVNQAVSRGANF